VARARPEIEAQPAAAPGPDGPTRVGILGGTFDPPHLGHLWLAALASDALALDQVLFMPAASPPHKQGQPMSHAAERVAMTRLAVTGQAGFEVSLVELQRPGPSYTVDTLSQLREEYPDTEFTLLMAADTLAGIDGWREPEQVLALAEWAVAPRPGSVVPTPARLSERFGPAASRIHLLDGPALDISSTEIRARVAAGRTIRYLVLAAVEDYVRDRGLYRR
jgi:nicotinate-nucleotide adenylyltransferase